MTLPVFPRLAGQGWPIVKRPITATRVARHVSGREVRTPLFVAPLYEFELTFEALSSNSSFPNLTERSFQELQGLYLACGGQALPFVYIDPSEHRALGQPVGTGDGSTRTFALSRSVGSLWTEPVGTATSVQNVFINGAVAGNPPNNSGQRAVWMLSDWNGRPNAALTFAAAPLAGSLISADFTYGFVCRFVDDQVEFENFMRGLWSMSSLKFTTFR